VRDMKADLKFMRQAIAKAWEGVREKEAPFGACIVKGNKVVVLAHNSVFSDCNSTAHAEINAIKHACRKLRTIDLSGCTIYSTTEPCPMCFSAIHWAKMNAIVFGTRIRDAKKIGFSEIPLTNRKLRLEGRVPIKIIGNVMRKETLGLLNAWKKKAGKVY